MIVVTINREAWNTIWEALGPFDRIYNGELAEQGHNNMVFSTGPYGDVDRIALICGEALT